MSQAVIDFCEGLKTTLLGIEDRLGKAKVSLATGAAQVSGEAKKHIDEAAEQLESFKAHAGLMAQAIRADLPEQTAVMKEKLKDFGAEAQVAMRHAVVFLAETASKGAEERRRRAQGGRGQGERPWPRILRHDTAVTVANAPTDRRAAANLNHASRASGARMGSSDFDHRLEPHVRVRHAIGGRTRLRLDPLAGRADLLGALARRVAAREGMRRRSRKRASGSLLIDHDKRLTPEAIAETVREIWRAGLTGAVAAAPADATAEITWHALPAEFAQAAYASKAPLTDTEAHERITRIGENRLPEPIAPPLLGLIAAQFKSAPVALLGGSAVLSLATGGLLDAALTLGVIALNAGIGASTENWTAGLIRSPCAPERSRCACATRRTRDAACRRHA